MLPKEDVGQSEEPGERLAFPEQAEGVLVDIAEERVMPRLRKSQHCWPLLERGTSKDIGTGGYRFILPERLYAHQNLTTCHTPGESTIPRSNGNPRFPQRHAASFMRDRYILEGPGGIELFSRSQIRPSTCKRAVGLHLFLVLGLASRDDGCPQREELWLVLYSSRVSRMQILSPEVLIFPDGLVM